MQIPMSKIYKIDGKPIPRPSAANVSTEDVHSSDSGRDAAGKMQLEVVRFGVRTVEIAYDMLPQEQMQALLKMFHKPYYLLTYKDPEYGPKTIECYVPSRKSELYSAVFYNGLWRNVTFSCIER